MTLSAADRAAASEKALDAKIAQLRVDVLTEAYTELRGRKDRGREGAIVLGKLGTELERRMGEDAFDALLDQIEETDRAAS